MLKVVVCIVTTGLQKVEVPSRDGTLSVGHTTGVKKWQNPPRFLEIEFSQGWRYTSCRMWHRIVW